MKEIEFPPRFNIVSFLEVDNEKWATEQVIAKQK